MNPETPDWRADLLHTPYPEVVTTLKSEAILDERTGILLVPLNGDEEEIEAHKRWFADPYVRKGLYPATPFLPHDPSTRVSVGEFIEYFTNSPNFVYFRILYPDGGDYRYIGHISMNDIDVDTMRFSVSITIGEKEFWGKGIGRMVEEKLLENAKRLGFRTVYEDTPIRNRASQSIHRRVFGQNGINRGDIVHFEMDLQKWQR